MLLVCCLLLLLRGCCWASPVYPSCTVRPAATVSALQCANAAAAAAAAASPAAACGSAAAAEDAGLPRAAAAVCARVASAPECLQQQESLLHAMEALRRLQLLHVPLLTEIGEWGAPFSFFVFFCLSLLVSLLASSVSFLVPPIPSQQATTSCLLFILILSAARALQLRFAAGAPSGGSRGRASHKGTNPSLGGPPQGLDVSLLLDGDSKGPHTCYQRLHSKEDIWLVVEALSCFAAAKATEFQALFRGLADSLVEVYIYIYICM